jgi:Secretion system C-terminal sorting domain
MKKFTSLLVFAIVANTFFSTIVSAQISLVTGSPESGTTTNTTLTIDRPSGVLAGDVMIANIVQSDNDGNTLSDALLNGWTEIDGRDIGVNGDDHWRGTILYRVATLADESVASYAFTVDSDAGEGSVGAIVAFRGVDITGGVTETGAAGGLFDVDPGTISTSANANISTVTASAISTNSVGAAVIMFGLLGNNQNFNSNWQIATGPLALAELYDIPNNSGLDNGIGAAWALRSSTGNTDPGTVTLSGNARNGGILIALKPLPTFTVNAGPDQLVGGTSVALTGSTTAGGTPVYAWTKTSGPAGHSFSNAAIANPTVSGLTAGLYVFRLTVNGSVFDEVSVRVVTGTNLWASSSDGQQISSFTVAGGTYTSGPTNMFAPTYPGAVNTYTRTAALGRNNSPSNTAGYFYWLGTSSGTNANDGLVEVFAASAAGSSPVKIGSFDFNGTSGTDLGFVRLGVGPDGTGWILAGDETNLYLAKFASNGLNPVTIIMEDATVSLTGGAVSTFVNGDLCIDGSGKIFALANNGSGLTQIFIGSPAGGSTTLVKKWDLVVAGTPPTSFTGTVNGVAFDLLGSLYISTETGLYYINSATVNGPAGTVQCSLVQAQTGLQDLASNVFPSTILVPIKLAAFTAIKQGSNALVSWTTASEINADHFEIERSYDGVNFVSVGNKQAVGNSSTDVNYNFIDPITVSSGIIYYRLKTIDIDGKESISKIVSLKLNGGPIKDFTVYPNPFATDLKIQLNAATETTATVRISNIAGQTVVAKTVLLQKGANTIVLAQEISTLQKGVHLIEITADGIKLSNKVIKN